MNTTDTPAKHTPGPWTIAPDLTSVVGSNGATVVNLHGAMGGDDTTADAALIASAPALLAACETALEARIDTIRTAYGVRNASDDSKAVRETVGADYVCVALRAALSSAKGGAS